MLPAPPNISTTFRCRLAGFTPISACPQRAHATITSLDLDAVRAAPGVVAVLTNDDVTGHNDVSSAGIGDEPLFADDEVLFWGQPLFAVIAETREQARRAAALAQVGYADLPLVLDPDAAMAAGGELVTKPLVLRRGDARSAIDAAEHRISARMVIGGQEHFYLESQIALAIPGEDDDITVFASTQHPSEIQHVVSHVLGVPSNAVTVTVRRMGGGFGGKETQGNLFAVVAALAAKKLNRAIKIRPDRDDDFSITGKRHNFTVDYEIGFTEAGKITGVDGKFMAQAGWSADLSGPVSDRALFHADNAYFYPAVRLESFARSRPTPPRTRRFADSAARRG